MKKSKSLMNELLTVFDKRFAFSFIMMLIVWSLPSSEARYSSLHLLPESVVIFILGENMKKVVNSLILCVMPVLLLVIFFIVPQLLPSISLTLSTFVLLIFAVLFMGGYIFGKRT